MTSGDICRTFRRFLNLKPMKAFFLILIPLFLFCTVRSQNTDYLTKSEFQSEKKKVNENIAVIKKQGVETRKSIIDLKTREDTLNKLLTATGIKLDQSVDSLNKTSAKMNALRDQVESQKGVTRPVFITLSVIIFVLLIVLFFLLVMIRNSTARLLKNHEEENLKANATIASELQKKEDAIRENSALIHSTANEIKEKIAGLSSRLEQNLARMDQQFKENLQGLENKIGSVISDEIGIKEEIEKVFRNSEQSVAAVKKTNESEHKDLSTKIIETSKEIKDTVSKTRAELDALKAQLNKTSQHNN